MRTNRGRSITLLVIAGWTLFVWLTFIRNMLGDHTHSARFKEVHIALAVICIATAVVVGLIGLRLRQEDRSSRDSPAPRDDASRRE